MDPLSQEGEFIQGGSVASYIMCIAESSETVSSSQQKSANLAIVVSCSFMCSSMVEVHRS